MKIRKGILSVALVVGVFLIAGHALAAEGGYQFVFELNNGRFLYPTKSAVDGSGNLYVADTSNNRIQKFNSNGGYITQWGSYGSGNGQFMNPRGIAVDSSGNVFVADYDNHRIQKFTYDGVYITQWGSYGSGNNHLKYPEGVAVDTSGNVYVADTGRAYYGGSGPIYELIVDSNHRILKFTSNGVFITQWGSYGSGNGQFYLPRGVAVDLSGNVYVADTGNSRILKFTSDGVYITKWGSYGSEDGQFYGPYGVTVDTSGNVYVADTVNLRIQKFAPPEKVNDLVSFIANSSTYEFTSDTSGCPAGFAGKFSFQTMLIGKSTSPSLTGLILEVATLTNGNLLLNTDGGPGGAGSWMTVPKYMGNADGTLGPGEFIVIPFSLCLKQRKSFSFFVDVLGIAQ